MDREIDKWIGAVSAVMRTLKQSVVVKREVSQNAKLSIYRSIYVLTLTQGHLLWVVTKRMRSSKQGAKMNLLRRVSGLSLRDRVRSSDIQEETLGQTQGTAERLWLAWECLSVQRSWWK